MAGPAKREAFRATEFSAIAFGMSSGGTSLEYRACLAGASKPTITPEMKFKTYMAYMLMVFVRVSNPRANITSIKPVCVHIIMCLRLKRSLKTPAKGSMNRIGICDKKTAVESWESESVSLKISQPVATC